MTRRPLLVLSTIFFGFAAHAALVFGPEHAVSPIEYAPPLGAQWPDAVATDGTDFLVVWHDGMLGREGIYAARVNSAGETRPESQLVIRRGVVASSAAIWNGSSYLIFWSEGASATTMMAKVSREGVLIEPPRVLLERAIVKSGAVVTNGTNVLVTYVTSVYPSDLHALLLDGNGNVVRDVTIASAVSGNEAMSAATDGSSFLLVWTTQYSTQGMHVMATRLSAQGAIELQVEIFAAPLVDGVGVAYGGGTYAAVIRSTQQPSGVRIVALTIDPASLHAFPPVLLDTGSYEPAIAYNGNEFVAYWSASGGLRATSFAPASLPSPSPVVGVSSVVSSRARFVWNGRNFLAVWMDQSRGGPYSSGADVFALLLDDRGHPVSPAPALVAFAPVTQTTPAIAAAGDEAVAVWVEETTDRSTGRLLGARISADGTAGTPVELAAQTSTNARPEIIFTGSAYFVLWTEGEERSSLFGRRLELDGAPGPVISFGDGHSGALAVSATTTLVAFMRPNGDVAAVRMTNAGAVIDSTPLTIAKERFGYNMSAASNGSDFLLVWTEGGDGWQFPPPNLRDVFGARLMSNGASDATPLPIATGSSNQFFPAVASDGRDFLVVYNVYTADSYDVPSLATRRVLREGQIFGATATSDGRIVGHGFEPRIKRDGDGFLVTSLTRDAGLLTRLDAAGVRREPVITIPAATGIGAARAGNVVHLIYARPMEIPRFGAADRLFIRAGLDAIRGRSVRH